MRNSKRILALVLAVLMVVGLMTTAVAAPTQPNLDRLDDANQVSNQFRPAAQVLVALNIVRGASRDGGVYFDAGRDVSRAEMVALIHRMVISATATPPRPTTAPFTDVPANHWAAGYIHWATNQGIVAGRGGGIFDPDAPVTIIEASVMLLQSLGWGALGEYRGSGWDTNAWTDASRVGLFAVIDTPTPNWVSPATREQSTQMLYNAMFSRFVHFNELTRQYEDFFLTGDSTLAFNRHNISTTLLGAAGATTQAQGRFTLTTASAISAFEARMGRDVRSSEVGRIVQVFDRSGGQDRIATTISTEIHTAAGQTNAQVRSTLGPNRDITNIVTFNGVNMGDPIADLGTLPANDTRSATTWVLDGNNVISAVTLGATVRNVQVLANGNVVIQNATCSDAATAPAGTTILAANVARDITARGFNIAPAGRHVVSARLLDDGHWVLEALEEVRGTIAQFGVWGAAQNPRFVVGGRTIDFDPQFVAVTNASWISAAGNSFFPSLSADAITGLRAQVPLNHTDTFEFFINPTSGRAVAMRTEADVIGETIFGYITAISGDIVQNGVVVPNLRNVTIQTADGPRTVPTRVDGALAGTDAAGIVRGARLDIIAPNNEMDTSVDPAVPMPNNNQNTQDRIVALRQGHGVGTGAQNFGAIDLNVALATTPSESGLVVLRGYVAAGTDFRNTNVTITNGTARTVTSDGSAGFVFNPQIAGRTTATGRPGFATPATVAQTPAAFLVQFTAYQPASGTAPGTPGHVPAIAESWVLREAVIMGAVNPVGATQGQRIFITGPGQANETGAYRVVTFTAYDIETGERLTAEQATFHVATGLGNRGFFAVGSQNNRRVATPWIAGGADGSLHGTPLGAAGPNGTPVIVTGYTPAGTMTRFEFGGVQVHVDANTRVFDLRTGQSATELENGMHVWAHVTEQNIASIVFITGSEPATTLDTAAVNLVEGAAPQHPIVINNLRPGATVNISVADDTIATATFNSADETVVVTAVALTPAPTATTVRSTTVTVVIISDIGTTSHTIPVSVTTLVP